MKHVKDAIESKGFLLVEGHRPERTTEEVARTMGVVTHIDGLPLVQRLIPQTQEESTENLYSGHFGLGKFPWHSDLAHWYAPPRYFMLRCIVPGSSVYTCVLRSDEVADQLGMSVAARALFTPRKPVGGRTVLLPLIQKGDRQRLLRWDQLFLLPQTSDAERARSLLMDIDARFEFEKIYLSKPGDTVIIDNWRMLHGRGEVPTSEKHRVLERVYLEALI